MSRTENRRLQGAANRQADRLQAAQHPDPPERPAAGHHQPGADRLRQVAVHPPREAGPRMHPGRLQERPSAAADRRPLHLQTARGCLSAEALTDGHRMPGSWYPADLQDVPAPHRDAPRQDGHQTPHQTLHRILSADAGMRPPAGLRDTRLQG